jgi:cytoskeletal protein CcmA (bactofilin family)
MAIFSSGEGDGMPDNQSRGHGRDSSLSIVAPDLTVTGELKTEGVVKIDGVVEGNVHADRQVLVSKGGRVNGDVITKEAIVGGTVAGSIQASERVEVQTTATVHGDIATPRILVHEGGEVNGNVRMGNPSAGASQAVAAKPNSTTVADRNGAIQKL